MPDTTKSNTTGPQPAPRKPSSFARYLGPGMAIGIGIGTAMGAAFNDMALGMGIGVGLGPAMALGMAAYKDRQRPS